MKKTKEQGEAPRPSSGAVRAAFGGFKSEWHRECAIYNTYLNTCIGAMQKTAEFHGIKLAEVAQIIARLEKMSRKEVHARFAEEKKQ